MAEIGKKGRKMSFGVEQLGTKKYASICLGIPGARACTVPIVLSCLFVGSWNESEESQRGPCHKGVN